MRKSTPTLTLTQSGPLAVLLQRQRDAVIQLDRHAHRKHMRAAFWKTLTWPFRALTARTLDYTGRRQQIHDDLRIQHPEWVEPNGECPTCDSYESRLTEMLDTLTRTGFTARFKIDDSLSDLTAQNPLQLESSQPCGAKIAVTASTNSANPKL